MNAVAKTIINYDTVWAVSITLGFVGHDHRDNSFNHDSTEQYRVRQEGKQTHLDDM